MSAGAAHRPVWLGPWRLLNGRWTRPYRRPWYPAVTVPASTVTTYFIGWITDWKVGPHV